MREIKFRIWNDHIKEMLYKFVLGSDGEVYATAFMGDEKIILMQYTGLEDKNGKEIYEGDIVRDSSDSTMGTRKWQIIWENCGLEMQTKYLMRSLDFGESLEVIGNIYENPELLKEE